LKRQI